MTSLRFPHRSITHLLLAMAELVGNRIKFSYCSLDRAIALLKEQYAIGTVEIKIVR